MKHPHPYRRRPPCLYPALSALRGRAACAGETSIPSRRSPGAEETRVALTSQPLPPPSLAPSKPARVPPVAPARLQGSGTLQLLHPGDAPRRPRCSFPWRPRGGRAVSSPPGLGGSGAEPNKRDSGQTDASAESSLPGACPPLLPVFQGKQPGGWRVGAGARCRT